MICPRLIVIRLLFYVGGSSFVVEMNLDHWGFGDFERFGKLLYTRIQNCDAPVHPLSIQ